MCYNVLSEVALLQLGESYLSAKPSEMLRLCIWSTTASTSIHVCAGFWLSFTAHLTGNQAIAALQTTRKYRVCERFDHVPAEHGRLSGEASYLNAQSLWNMLFTICVAEGAAIDELRSLHPQ